MSFAARYEPGFKKRFTLTGSKASNTGRLPLRALSASIVLHPLAMCQVMGPLARELRFTGLSLIELCDPRTGLYYGARRLKKALDRKHGEVSAALLDYNGSIDKDIPGTSHGEGGELCLS